jgi:hypothetical protein
VPSDYFALLDEPRRPWLDPNAVQTKFLALSAHTHPDHVHLGTAEEKAEASHRFTLLNAAGQCLRDPKQRIRHLLELERGSQVEQLERLQSSATDLYFNIGQVCQRVDRWLAQLPRTLPPLFRAQIFEQSLQWTTTLKQLQAELADNRLVLESDLKALNRNWETASPIGTPDRRKELPLDRLEHLYRELSFNLRWSSQIGERLLRIATTATG